MYSCIQKGKYGLNQAAYLVCDAQKYLSTCGYEPHSSELNLWTHKRYKTKTCLCVNGWSTVLFPNQIPTFH